MTYPRDSSARRASVNSRFSLPDRYFGVLASHHHLRPRVVPGPGAELPGQQLPLAFADRDAAEPDGSSESKAPRRIGWASLLARVFVAAVSRPHPYAAGTTRVRL